MEAGTTLLGNDWVPIQEVIMVAWSNVMAVEMEGKVLNLRDIFELQLMELSDDCEGKRNQGRLWFGLNNCRMMGPFTNCWMVGKLGYRGNWFRGENQGSILDILSLGML